MNSVERNGSDDGQSAMRAGLCASGKRLVGQQRVENTTGVVGQAGVHAADVLGDLDGVGLSHGDVTHFRPPPRPFAVVCARPSKSRST